MLWSFHAHVHVTVSPTLTVTDPGSYTSASFGPTTTSLGAVVSSSASSWEHTASPTKPILAVAASTRRRYTITDEPGPVLIAGATGSST